MDQNSVIGSPPQDDRGKVLFFLFRPRLRLALASVPRVNEYYLSDECILDGRRFQDKNYDGVTDFSDWLRNPTGRVIGVRFWPYEEMRFLSDQLGQFSYVAVTEQGKQVAIYLSDDRQVDEEKSADQNFATNKVYSTDDGEWAIAFRATQLSVPEIEGVYAADAEWVSADVSVARGN